ncbi:MAG: DUF927 domain-containing protein [Ahniella sp.]|nr:DUF927 domain-containing protein [Ahniella sp.]
MTRPATRWGRRLCIVDRDGNERRWAMPMSLLARDGAEFEKQLLSMGAELDLDIRKRRLFLDFIQNAEPGRFARCVSRTGWHGDSFCHTCGHHRQRMPGESLVFRRRRPAITR